MRRRNSPLQILRPETSTRTGSAAIAGERRGKTPPPEIYVKVRNGYWRSNYARAHLRNHRGYMELCWRDGKRIRTLHLGKVRKNSPTAAAPGPARRRPAPAPARRGKTRSKF
jgi:hypothetical protein